MSEFSRKGIYFKSLDLDVDTTTPAGKSVLQIFATLAEYDGTGHPAKEPAGEDPCGPEASTLVGRKGVNTEKSAKGRTALERGLSVAETVSLTGIRLSTMKRYRKPLEKLLTRPQ